MRAAHRVEHAEAVEARHDEVEDEHVGLQGSDELERLMAVVGLTDDLDRRVTNERPDDSLADEREVVGGDDANLHVPTSPLILTFRRGRYPLGRSQQPRRADYRCRQPSLAANRTQTRTSSTPPAARKPSRRIASSASATRSSRAISPNGLISSVIVVRLRMSRQVPPTKPSSKNVLG